MKSAKHHQYAKWIVVALCFWGCAESEEKLMAPSLENDGVYELVSLKADKQYDLNHDGFFSDNILSETNEQKNMARYFAELKTEVYTWTGQTPRYDQQIVVWLPYANIIIDDNETYQGTQYGFTGVIVTYTYNKDNSIKILSSQGQGATVTKAVIDGERLNLSIQQYYYTSAWAMLNLSATYQKAN